MRFQGEFHQAGMRIVADDDSSLRMSSLLHETAMERRYQANKWGDEFSGRDPDEWLAILMEEVGESAAASNPQHLRTELVQVAAVALAWAQHIGEQGEPGEVPHGAGQVLRFDAIQLGERARTILGWRSVGDDGDTT